MSLVSDFVGRIGLARGGSFSDGIFLACSHRPLHSVVQSHLHKGREKEHDKWILMYVGNVLALKVSMDVHDATISQGCIQGDHGGLYLGLIDMYLGCYTILPGQ